MKTILLHLACFQIFSTVALPHDLWLATQWNPLTKRTEVCAVVAESFPAGERVSDKSRFEGLHAWVPSRGVVALRPEPSDSTLLGSLSGSSVVVATTVKPRQITFGRDLAGHYLRDEIGMAEEEMSELLTPGVDEFTETYTRYLKNITFSESAGPTDSLRGLPLEIGLKSWTKQDGLSTIRFLVLNNGLPAKNAPVRLLTRDGATVVRTDSAGTGQVEVAVEGPILLSYIQISRLTVNTLGSEWTNLSIYPLRD